MKPAWLLHPVILKCILQDTRHSFWKLWYTLYNLVLRSKGKWEKEWRKGKKEKGKMKGKNGGRGQWQTGRRSETDLFPRALDVSVS